MILFPVFALDGLTDRNIFQAVHLLCQNTFEKDYTTYNPPSSEFPFHSTSSALGNPIFYKMANFRLKRAALLLELLPIFPCRLPSYFCL